VRLALLSLELSTSFIRLSKFVIHSLRMTEFPVHDQIRETIMELSTCVIRRHATQLFTPLHFFPKRYNHVCWLVAILQASSIVWKNQNKCGEGLLLVQCHFRT
jgi:hypothetical protein